MRNTIFFFVFMLFIQLAIAQNAVGDWKSHFSWGKAKSLCTVDNLMYVASEQGIFVYDFEAISETKTKVSGLSDADILSVYPIPQTDEVIVIYENSNIDIISDGVVENFSEIKRKQISGDKQIYNLLVDGNTIYLSCGFGIVLFDFQNREFIDTYYIGETGNFIPVYQVTFTDDYLYAATNEGLKRALISTGNFFDFNNWEPVNLPETGPVNAVQSVNNQIYVSVKVSESTNTVYTYSGSSWDEFSVQNSMTERISLSESYLFFAGGGQLSVFDHGGNYIRQISQYSINSETVNSKINRAVEGLDGNLYFADSKYSLVKELSAGNYATYSPDGPSTNELGKLEITNRKLIGTAGGWIDGSQTNLNNEAAYFTYDLSDETYDSNNYTYHDDFYSAAPVDAGAEHLFIGSWNEGLFEIKNGEIVNIYDETNSTLQSILPDFQSVRIGGIHMDDNDNIWVTNSNVAKPISVLTTSGEWYSYGFSGVSPSTKYIGITKISDGNFWIPSPRDGGILVFNHNNTPADGADDEHSFFIPRTRDGTESSNNVNCIEEDNDGTVWVGTREGIFVYYSPENALESSFYADRIQITTVGADTSEQYLLKTESVTCIKTDGANRKWIGTLNSGLFLVSPGGKEQIHTFNTENSPLLSNSIKDVSIDHETGRVFVATSKGMLSYRAEATKGGDIFESVYVFPNPVRPEYDGKIIVTGLVSNANVKITDVSGQLVYETTALGGQAVWDGTDLNNQRVSTGVYLIFCSNQEASATHVTKLLFVN